MSDAKEIKDNFGDIIEIIRLQKYAFDGKD